MDMILPIASASIFQRTQALSEPFVKLSFMQSINFSADELSTLKANLKEYAPAQVAIDQIKASEGDLNLAIEAMLVEEFGPQPTFANRSLWEVTKETLREELCGDDGFLGKVKAYSAEPQKATALTALVIYIVEQTALTISPAFAALVVLYIAKVGLKTFCKYTEPESRSL